MTAVVRLRRSSGAILAVASVLGLVAFTWPLFVDPVGSENLAHSGDAPWVFLALLPLLFAVIVAELADGALDAKAVALLGVLRCVRRRVAPAGWGDGLRADVLHLHPGRPGVRSRLRIRARRAHDVRVGVDHGRCRSLAAVPDVRRGVGRILCRLSSSSRGSSRGVPARGLRLRRRSRLRPAAQHVVLAVRRQRRFGAGVRARCGVGREPASVLGLPPGHVARLGPAAGRAQRRSGVGRRRARAGRAAAGRRAVPHSARRSNSKTRPDSRSGGYARPRVERLTRTS